MRIKWQPEFVHYNDLAVSPLDAGSSKLRLLFRVSQATAALPHLRFQNSELIDIATATHDEGLPNRDRVPGVSLYAGVYFPHFGHFVSECIHRLYARNEDARLRNAKVVFHVGAKHRITPWVFPTLEICGVKPDEVIFIDKPRRFEELVVPPQARIHNGPSFKPGYAETFPPGAKPVKGGESYYVSRVKHYYSGSYAGERIVEEFLKSHGFKVLYPEDHELSHSTGLLSAAANIIFSEGSAIHNIELCGKTQARIMIIARRPGTRGRFGHIIEEHGSEARIFERMHILGPLEWNPATNTPNWARSVSLVDLRAAITEISEFFELEPKLPTQQECEQAILADLGRFILDRRTTRRESNEELGRSLSLMRENFEKRPADTEQEPAAQQPQKPAAPQTHAAPQTPAATQTPAAKQTPAATQTPAAPQKPAAT